MATTDGQPDCKVATTEIVQRWTGGGGRLSLLTMGDGWLKTGAEAFSDAGVGQRKATGTKGSSGPAAPAIDPGDGDSADGKHVAHLFDQKTFDRRFATVPEPPLFFFDYCAANQEIKMISSPGLNPI